MFRKMQAVVRRIPRGKVLTYGDVAYLAGFPGSARQVVWALRADAGTLPWHRVIGAGGKILLTGQPGLEQKIRLRTEGVEFSGERVRMELHHAKEAIKKLTKRAAKKKATRR